MSTDLVPAETKKQVLTAQSQANSLKVTNPDEAENGSSLLKSIKDYHKALIERKEEMTRPLMKSLASIRDLFKPLESDLTDAEKIVKQKLLAFQIEEEDRIAKETDKVTAKVEAGRMRADTAAGKLEAIGEVKKVKGMQIRTLTKIRIMDETMIPREYMIPNMPLITEAILRKGLDVMGVEKYEEKSLASV